MPVTAKKLDAASERIGGYNGALEFLDRLPDAVARKCLLPAMRAADRIGKDAAEAEARKHTSSKPKKGDHLVTTTGAAEAQRGGAVMGKVGFFGQAGSHGWLVEHGHRMVVGGRVARTNPKPGKSKPAPSEAGRVVGQVEPHPILLPAYEQAKGAMEQGFAEEVIVRADKAATQLAKETGAT